MNTPAWLVIASTVEAIIYQIEKNNPFSDQEEQTVIIKHFLNENGRLKTSDLINDKPDHYRFDGTNHVKSMHESNAHEADHQKFAREIASFLEEHRKINSYQSIILCAEPGFYGMLKKAFPEDIIPLIKQHILKDYVPLPAHKKSHIIQEIQKSVSM